MVLDTSMSRISRHDGDPEEGETENIAYSVNSPPVYPLPPPGIFAISAVPTTFGHSPRSSFRMPSESAPSTITAHKPIATFFGDPRNVADGKGGTVKINPQKQMDFHSAFVSQKHTAPHQKDKKVCLSFLGDFFCVVFNQNSVYARDSKLGRVKNNHYTLKEQPSVCG